MQSGMQTGYRRLLQSIVNAQTTGPTNLLFRVGLRQVALTGDPWLEYIDDSGVYFEPGMIQDASVPGQTVAIDPTTEGVYFNLDPVTLENDSEYILGFTSVAAVVGFVSGGSPQGLLWFDLDDPITLAPHETVAVWLGVGVAPCVETMIMKAGQKPSSERPGKGPKRQIGRAP